MTRINFVLDEEINPYPWEEQLNQGEYWMDRWGSKHPIREMSTDYIRNALRFAYQAARYICSQIWNALAIVNGDMAEYTLELILVKYENASSLPLIAALEKELERREV